MADNRQSKRTPVTLKIKFKSETLDQFINRYAVDVSHGGIFIRTKDPLPVGTAMRFEFQLKDSSPLIKGEGTVVWTRDLDPSRKGVAPGMGVRFDRLSEGSNEVLDQILTRKAGRDSSQAFLDTPTRVVPSSADHLSRLRRDGAADSGTFGDERADSTPLPTPMPFHSDAGDFADETFDQATKVHSMEDLAALTATDDIDAIEDELLGDSDDAPGAEGLGRRPRPDSEAETRLVGDPLLPGSMMFAGGKPDAQSRAETVPFEGHDLAMLDAIDSAADAPSGSDGFAGVDDDVPTRALALPADDPARDAVDELSDEHPLPPASGADIGVDSLDVTTDRALLDDGDDDDSADTDAAADVDDAPAAAAMAPPETIAPGDEEPAAARESRAREPEAAAAGKADARTAPASRDSARPAVASAKESPRARDDRESDEAPDKADSESSSLPLVLVAIVLLLALCAGVYFMLLRKRDDGGVQAGTTPATTPATTPDTRGAVVPQRPADAAPARVPDAAPVIEADAGVADAAVEQFTMDPDAVMVDIKLRSEPDRAMAELVGTDQKGPTPITFQVAEGRTYTARVTKDGYASQEVTLDPAQPGAVRVKLAPMPMLLRITSVPEGAHVYIDGRRVPDLTPATFELPDSFRKKRRFKVAIRHGGYEKLDIMADADFRQEGETLVMDVAGTLVKAAAKPARGTGATKPDDEAKPDEAKPDETKPDETKPDEAKPDETKPDEAKPDEAKPDETKPDETKPEAASTEAPSAP